MTTSHHIVMAVTRKSALLELALVLLVALVAALWLALFSIVPLDFRPPRVS